MEYEAVDDGVMAKIVVPEGTNDVAVNQLIAVMAQEGEDVKAAAASAASAPAKAPSAGAPSTPPSPPRGEGAAQQAAAPSTSAPAQKEAKSPPPPQAPRAPSPQRGEGGGEGVRTNGHGAGTGTNRIFSSPLARRLAKDAGIELNRIQGTGPHGRVIARDVEAARSGQGLRAPAAAPASAPLDRAVDVGPADPRALRRRQLRFRAARRHAPHHCATTHRVGADHSAFLPDHRLRHRQASRGARGDQRLGAQRTRTASRPTSFRSTISSSRRWRWRCSACRTPT